VEFFTLFNLFIWSSVRSMDSIFTFGFVRPRECELNLVIQPYLSIFLPISSFTFLENSLSFIMSVLTILVTFAKFIVIG